MGEFDTSASPVSLVKDADSGDKDKDKDARDVKDSMSAVQKGRYAFISKFLVKDRVKGDRNRWLSEYAEYLKAGGAKEAGLELGRMIAANLG